MKHYLCKTKIQDGEHDYKYFNIYSANNRKEALKIAIEDDKQIFANDGRESETEWVKDITPKEEDTLTKFRVI